MTRLSPDNLKALDPQTESRILILAAIARERLGDRRGALAAAEANRAILAARVARFPIDPFHRGYLAVTLAQLGRKDEAIAHMEKALQVFPDDAFSALAFLISCYSAPGRPQLAPYVLAVEHR